jgi:predicted amidohydrolase YtcJ
MRDPAGRSPRLVLRNGKIITINARFEIAHAIALSGGHIDAVGSNADIAPLIDAHTRVIDLDGRTVIPGLIDAHAHMDREGLKEALPSLAGVRSIDDVLQRIETLVRERQPGEWIVTMPLGEPPEFEGMPERLRERRFPTRSDLDRVAPGLHQAGLGILARQHAACRNRQQPRACRCGRSRGHAVSRTHARDRP